MPLGRARDRSRARGGGGAFGAAVALPTTALVQDWDADSLALAAVASWASTGSLATALTQGTAANRPVGTAGGPNGHQYVSFDGSNDSLSCAFTSQAQPVQIFAVFKQRTIGATTVNDTIWDGGALAQVFLLQDNSPRAYIGAPTTLTWLSNLVGNGVYEQVNARYNGGSSYLRSSRVTRVSGAAGANALTGFTLGALFGGTRPTAIDVARVLIYAASAATLDAQEAQVEAYLAQRYGVS